MRKIKIKIINKSGFDLPEYKTEQSAGCDLVAPIDAPIKLYRLTGYSSTPRSLLLSWMDMRRRSEADPD